MASDTRKLRVVVTGESAGAQQALEEVGKTSETTESKLGKLAKTVAGFAGKGVLAFGAVGAAAATMGISTASQMEQAQVGFTTMLGSGKKAEKFLKDLQQFANSTPFEFTELTGAAQQLMAMGFAAKDVIPMLTAVGDAVAAMGGSQENIDAVTTALGQMQAKGKVSGEELMQLTDQGIPALKILADSYKVSTAQMSAMITAGKIQSDKAIPLLIKGLEQGTKSVKGFGGMMNAQSQTMKGQWSTLMDTLQTGLGNIAKNFLPAAKTGIGLLSNAMGAFFQGLSGAQGKFTGFLILLIK
jgi:tape measure domain-containing protein